MKSHLETFLKTACPGSVQMCWLMSHRVDGDTPNIGNLLRLTKKEVVSFEKSLLSMMCLDIQISSTYTTMNVLNSLFYTNDSYDHANDSFASSQNKGMKKIGTISSDGKYSASRQTGVCLH
jgi:hypothetical protein